LPRSDAHQDGGRNALAGYLYQLVATLGCAVRLDESAEGSPPGEKLLWAERLGQDAGRASGTSIELVQMKHSVTDPARRIDACEAREIAEAFTRAVAEARRVGYTEVTCCLVTDREFAPRALGKLPARIERTIMDALRSPDRRDLSRAYSDLLALAAQYGCSPDEAERGIDLLLGRTLRQTALSVSSFVRKRDVIEAFTGCAESRTLVPTRLAKSARDAVESRMARLQEHEGPLFPTCPVPRQCLLGIDRHVALGRGLVLVTGDGGVGKTVALHQWALRVATGFSDRPPRPAVVGHADGVSGRWPDDTVAEWSHNANGHWVGREHAKVLERLRLAAEAEGHKGHVLLLCLDGLDEEWEGGRKLAKLLRHYHDADRRRPAGPQTSVLIVACRRGRMECVERALSDDPGRAFPLGPEQTALVEIGPFDENELLAAAASEPGLAGAARDAIERWARPVVGGHAAFDDTAHPSDAVAPAGNGERIQALLHPAVWGCFVSVGPQSQEAYIRGDPRGMRDVVCALLRWAVGKAKSRRPQDGWPTDDEILAALHALALRTSETGPYHRTRDWALLGADDYHWWLDAVYQECLDLGVIGEDTPGQWRWSLRLVRDYLCGSAEANGDA